MPLHFLSVGSRCCLLVSDVYDGQPLAPWEQHGLPRQRKALVRGRELKGSNGLHGVFGIRFVGLNNNGSLLETVVSSEYIPRKSEILKTGHPHIARCSHPLV